MNQTVVKINAHGKPVSFEMFLNAETGNLNRDTYALDRSHGRYGAESQLRRYDPSVCTLTGAVPCLRGRWSVELGESNAQSEEGRRGRRPALIKGFLCTVIVPEILFLI